MAFDAAQFQADIDHRSRNQPGEHYLITMLVVLRVHLNHEYGRDFAGYDHELAQIEGRLAALLK